MTWIADWVKPRMTVVDVGANAGSVTAPLAQAVGRYGRVYAIEPHAELLEPLQRLGDQVRVITVALGSEDRAATLYQSRETVHASLWAPNVVEPTGERLVPMRRLDSLDLGPIDAMKIDAQGAEYSILRGGEETIGQWQPVLYLELWPQGLHAAGSCVDEVGHFLQARGYVPQGRPWASVYDRCAGLVHPHASVDVLFLPPGKVAA